MDIFLDVDEVAFELLPRVEIPSPVSAGGITSGQSAPSAAVVSTMQRGELTRAMHRKPAAFRLFVVTLSSVTD